MFAAPTGFADIGNVAYMNPTLFADQEQLVISVDPAILHWLFLNT